MPSRPPPPLPAAPRRSPPPPRSLRRLTPDELARVAAGRRRTCDCGHCTYCHVYDRNR